MDDKDYLSEMRSRLEASKRAAARRRKAQAELLSLADQSPLGGPLYEDPDAFEDSLR